MPDALLAIPEESKRYLDMVGGAGSERLDRYRAYREYYNGDHNTQLTDRQRAYLQIKIGAEFNDNYCPVVVDVLAERLEVTGFNAAEQDEDLWQWWDDNRMDHNQGVVHTAAIRDGDAYVLVQWDNDNARPDFAYEPAFDGGEGVEVVYDPDCRGRPLFAVKQWRDGQKRRRLNLYMPDRVEKYIRNDDEAGNWLPYQPEGDESWPIPWVSGDNEPLGIPLIHFRHQDKGYNYGKSELRDVVPLQNALNKAIIDLVAAADTTAFRIYWMLGDDPSDLEVTPGSWIFSSKPPSGDDGVAVGFFPGEDLSRLIEFKDAFVTEIARISRTPGHHFQIGGNRPAEGTLKQEEAGLVAKAGKAMKSFGNSWEDVIVMARKLWATFGGEPVLNLDEPVNVQWASAEVRTDPTVDEKLKAGVPREIIWREMGYSPDEIEEMKETDEYQQRQAQASVMLALAEQGGQDEG